MILAHLGHAIERLGPFGTKHRGILAGFDAYGRGWVIHNAKDDCVRWDLLEEFAQGLQVKVVVPAPNDFKRRLAIVERAKGLLGRRYDPLSFNCDHLVTFAITGEATSPQLYGAVACVLIAAILGAAVASRS